MNAPKTEHIEQYIRPRDGTLIRYDTKTNTIGYKHKDGTIGSMFKPSKNYFKNQYERDVGGGTQ